MAERSAGSSRIFRLAHATPGLVQVAQAAFARWSAAVGTPLVRRSGCVASGGDRRQWTAAMTAAGAPVEVAGEGSARLRLPHTSFRAGR